MESTMESWKALLLSRSRINPKNLSSIYGYGDLNFIGAMVSISKHY